MHCHQVQNLLSEYLDGELPVEQARSLEAHARSCSDCAKVLADLRGVISELHSLPALSAPLALHSSVMRRVRKDAQDAAPPPRPVTLGGAALLAAAACLAVVFTGFLLMQIRRRPSPQIASTLHEAQTPVERQPHSDEVQPEATPPRRSIASTVSEDSRTVTAKIALVQPAPMPAKPVALFKAEGKRVPAFEFKESTKPAAGREAPKQTLALGKKMLKGNGAEQASAPRARPRVTDAEGRAAPPRPAPEPATPSVAARAKPRRLRGPTVAQKAKLKTMTEVADALGQEPTIAQRTITVVTNDPDKAAADIGKRIRITRPVSQLRRSKATSGPITVVMTQPEYVALLTDLEKAGYTLEGQTTQRSQTRAETGPERVRQAKEELGRAEALRVTIRFRRAVADPAEATKARER